MLPRASFPSTRAGREQLIELSLAGRLSASLGVLNRKDLAGNSEDPRSSCAVPFLVQAAAFLGVTSTGPLGRASWDRIMSIPGKRRSTE